MHVWDCSLPIKAHIKIWIEKAQRSEEEGKKKTKNWNICAWFSRQWERLVENWEYRFHNRVANEYACKCVMHFSAAVFVELIDKVKFTNPPCMQMGVNSSLWCVNSINTCTFHIGACRYKHETEGSLSPFPNLHYMTCKEIEVLARFQANSIKALLVILATKSFPISLCSVDITGC